MLILPVSIVDPPTPQDQEMIAFLCAEAIAFSHAEAITFSHTETVDPLSIDCKQ